MENTELIPLNIDTEDGKKLVLQVCESLERLEQNVDFQTLYKAYTKNYLLDRASLFATRFNETVRRTNVLEYMVGVANFVDFLGLIKAFKQDIIDQEKQAIEEEEKAAEVQAEADTPVLL